MSAQLSYQRVLEHLQRLKMDTAMVHLDDILETGLKEERLTIEMLDHLLEREVQARFERRVQTNFRFAGLPFVKRLEDFDFAVQPQVSQTKMRELATLRFLHQGENLIFIGPCGVGKTHLAVALAVRALEEGHRICFMSLHELVTKTRLAREKNRLQVMINTIHRADLFVLDELGFLPLAAEDASFLFEVVNLRYQGNKPTIVTSNKPFSQWESVFPDSVLAVALLDRLLHHSHTIQIRGESYRLKHRRNAGLPSLGKEENV